MDAADAARSRERRVLGWLFVSGATALLYETVWLRRLSLLLGGSAVAGAVAVAAWMAGLALGGVLAPRLRGPSLRLWAALELFAALWAGLFPLWVAGIDAVGRVAPWSVGPLAAVAVAAPATALGATWPVLVRDGSGAHAGAAYAANTLGAVLGVLVGTFVLMPYVGVRSTELLAAAAGVAVASAAARAPRVANPAVTEAVARAPAPLLVMVGLAGVVSLGMEVVWFRLVAVGLGATVQATGLTLAVFLAGVALGAWAGRSPTPADRAVGRSMIALGVLALLGAASWSLLPYGIAVSWAWFGQAGVMPGNAILAAVAMGGAPAASGYVFAAAARALPDVRQAGQLVAANTLGAVIGCLVGGLVLIPWLGLRDSVLVLAGVAVIAGAAWQRAPAVVLVLALAAAALPAWDARMYAVGLYLRISDFADPSLTEVRRFADEGWDLVSYEHGRSAAVAVGRSRRTGNVWVSVNGKVDASTGDDMPTQQLSGVLPIRMHPSVAADVAVVGLASGVTAGSVLAEAGVAHLTVFEIEPAVVRASRAFDHASGAPLDDPRTRLIVTDARHWLDRSDATFDVIVSEPSNPWITGVSSLFTVEYWQIVRARLRPDGVVCQWIQLYGMGPDELSALVRTFLRVFPDAYLFETIPGSDVLLVGGAARLTDDLPIAPTLGPDQVRALGGEGWINTDDHPRVEFSAPRYLHLDTGPSNAERIRSLAAP
jgi:spermidine synthase